MKKTSYRFTFLIVLLSICGYKAFAQKKHDMLNNYLVKENLMKNNKLAIIACDSNERPLDQVSGSFLFTINGFKQRLVFREGLAITPHEIDKSSFVFLKHENATGKHLKLYYVLKSENGLNPIKINWILLLIIPVAIIVLASLYKRLILLAVIVLLAYFYFNHQNGLSLEGTFETIYDGIRHIIH